MTYYPIFLDLKGKTALVVGGGVVAQRKIETLLEHGAKVHVIARDLAPELAGFAEAGKVEHIGDEFHENHLGKAFIVIAATDDTALNRQVSRSAQKMGLLINAVDQPEDCNFIVPSSLKRGDLRIAVSTSGKSPALAKKVREDLEKHFGIEYELYLALMGRLRKEIIARGLSQEENSRIFRELVGSPILEAIGKEEWGLVVSFLESIAQITWTPEEVRTFCNNIERIQTSEP
jgi:precorrin-2 dehydrogenase/sirohydrochlorin ferrochelatase